MSLAALLQGADATVPSKLLTRNNGETVELDKFLAQNKERKAVFLIYISASWCGPCKQFTPTLADFVRTQNQKVAVSTAAADLGDCNRKAAVIFVSACRDVNSFNSYFASMPSDWLAVPFSETATRQRITSHFDVKSIPCLVTWDAVADKELTREGVAAFRSDPSGVQFPWGGYTLPWWRNRWMSVILRQLPMLLIFAVSTYFRRRAKTAAVMQAPIPTATPFPTTALHAAIQPVANTTAQERPLAAVVDEPLEAEHDEL